MDSTADLAVMLLSDPIEPVHELHIRTSMTPKGGVRGNRLEPNAWAP